MAQGNSHPVRPGGRTPEPVGVPGSGTAVSLAVPGSVGGSGQFARWCVGRLLPGRFGDGRRGFGDGVVPGQK